MHRPNRRIRPALLISVLVVIISLSGSVIVLGILNPHRPTARSSVNDRPAIAGANLATKTYSIPGQLKIDAINVAAEVVPVGLTAQGDMYIDEDPDKLAWYSLGPKPGEEGSAVIAGHYGWKDGAESAFNNIHTLVKGDTITSFGKDGRPLTFVVTRTATYEPAQDATDVFRSDDGKAHLNLITCKGSWDNQLNTYTERLVVFSELKI